MSCRSSRDDDSIDTIVTGPTKIGHVGANYTLPHNILYPIAKIGYFYFVTLMLQLTKLLRSAENVMAKQ